MAVVRMQGRTVAALLVLPWMAYSAFAYRPPGRFRTSLDDRTNLVTAQQVLDRYEEPLFPWFTGEGIYWENRPIDAEPGSELVRPTVARLAVGLPGYVLGPESTSSTRSGWPTPSPPASCSPAQASPGTRSPSLRSGRKARPTAAGSGVPSDQLTPGGFGFVEPLVAPTSGTRFDDQVDQVRRVLECDAVRELRDSYTEPLTAGRFFEDVVYSVRSVRLEIPPGPGEAERALC